MFVNYNFQPIIYAHTSKKQNNSQSHTFYTFEEYDEEEKINKWNLDCRLINTSYSISDYLLPYCIKLYQTIYKDCYGHNNYLPSHQNDIFTKDMAQLYSNIILLASYKEFRMQLEKLVMENFTISNKSGNKFDFVSEPKMIRLECESNEDTKERVFEQIKTLYDDFTISMFKF